MLFTLHKTNKRTRNACCKLPLECVCACVCVFVKERERERERERETLLRNYEAEVKTRKNQK